jgi:hypothetical protein
MDCVGALGPDPCRLDRHAPCFYFHLKMRALNGDFDNLTEEERAFVGVWTSRRSNDWHEPETDPEISDKLMDFPDGQRLEFLG